MCFSEGLRWRMQLPVVKRLWWCTYPDQLRGRHKPRIPFNVNTFYSHSVSSVVMWHTMSCLMSHFDLDSNFIVPFMLRFYFLAFSCQLWQFTLTLLFSLDPPTDSICKERGLLLLLYRCVAWRRPLLVETLLCSFYFNCTPFCFEKI